MAGLLDFGGAAPSGGGGLLDFITSDPGARMGLTMLAASSPRFGGGILQALQSQEEMKKNALQQQYIQSQIAENTSQNKVREMQMMKQMELQKFLSDKFSGVPSEAQAFAGGQAALAAGAQAGDVGPTVTNAQRQSTAVAQQPQSGFPLSFNEIVRLKTMGGPDLMDAYKASQEGFKQEAGNYYINPSTGQTTYRPKLDNGMTMQGDQVMPANGYAKANASIKGAEAGAVEAAKYPYTVGADRARQTTAAGLDMVDVPMQDGSKRQMTRLQASGMVGNGGQGGFGVTPSPVVQSAATGLNENWIKNGYQPTLDAGKAASDISSSIQAIRNIDLNTGWGTEAKATAANVLTGLGIAPQNASMFAANAQKFQSVAMDRLMTTLIAQKGPQTEGDATRASQTFAALKNTPEANKFIMDFAQAKANMDMRKAQFYEQALPLAQKQGDLTRVDREWRKIQGSIWADPILQPWSK